MPSHYGTRKKTKKGAPSGIPDYAKGLNGLPATSARKTGERLIKKRKKK